MSKDLKYSKPSGRFLAPYACFPEKSRGRLYDEQSSADRSGFQRDRDRIIHSTAFRRLEYKTQVFVFHEGDHFRNRLTHSMEVAQLARDACRVLHLEEDLAEAIALAHDFGHTAFGHAGEEAMQEVMQPFDGFDHNAQTIRILTHLERKYAAFDGLNLTWECLEGLAKHNGPVEAAPYGLETYNKLHDLELPTHASLEAQTAAMCDDIAYIAHDLEDGLRAGLFSFDDIEDLPLISDIIKNLPDSEVTRLHYELKRILIHIMLMDLVDNSLSILEKNNIESVEQVRNFGAPLITHTVKIADNIKTIKQYLFDNMYRHYKVNRMTQKASKVLKELFEYFMQFPESLPTAWQSRIESESDGSENGKARIIADFLSGMTDRFALDEHIRVFDPTHKLIGT